MPGLKGSLHINLRTNIVPNCHYICLYKTVLTACLLYTYVHYICEPYNMLYTQLIYTRACVIECRG